MRSSSSRRHRLEVHEVEPQPIRRHQRAGLLHVRAEHLAQRRVQQMRRRVVPPRRVADRRVDFRRDDVARREAPGGHAHAVRAGQPGADSRQSLDGRRGAAGLVDDACPESDTWPPASR